MYTFMLRQFIPNDKTQNLIRFTLSHTSGHIHKEADKEV